MVSQAFSTWPPGFNQYGLLSRLGTTELCSRTFLD
jgi:hypothetical protein